METRNDDSGRAASGPTSEADASCLRNPAPTRSMGTPATAASRASDVTRTLDEHPSSRGAGLVPATIGTTIGRYVVLGTRGEGGMGTVYEAFDRTLDRRVAVKVLRRDFASRDATRLVREAKALAQLSHPNVVQVYEVGEVDGQTFVAMELVQGRTLHQWRRQDPRPDWRACVELYEQAGAGLAAAHECGLVHRDFKPSNAVVDEKGRVRVLDFGLARTAGERARVERDADDRPSVSDLAASPESTGIDARVTDTGMVMGTPAYMPLEQMRRQDVDARGDQFSFCVALYEAVYGQRPFEGRRLEDLEAAVSEGAITPAPPETPVPTQLRAVLVRGLAASAEHRWPSMEALLEQLQLLVPPRRQGLEIAAAEWDRLGRPRAALWSTVQLDEAADLDRGSLRPREVDFLDHSQRAIARSRLARRIAALAVPAVVLATVGLLRLQAHWDLEERVDARLRGAVAQLERARADREHFLAARESAFAHYDAGADDRARESWASATEAARASDLEFAAATREFERALTLDPTRDDARARLGDALLERALLAELRHDPSRVEELTERLSLYDRDGVRRAEWEAPASLSIDTAPTGATLELAEYRRGPDGHIDLSVLRSLGHSPLRAHELPRGSYRVRITVDGRPPVLFPVLLERNMEESIALDVPRAEAIPPGFVYVPPGRFLVGCTDQTLCDVFYNSVPIHATTTEAFFIARHEVTYAEWLEFLEDHPADDRSSLLPRIQEGFVPVSLKQDAQSGWTLTFPREGGGTRAALGQPMVFGARGRRASQDWRRMPVGALSFHLASAYLRWLDRSGRVPGARHCTVREWERAGRGADDRLYPHGDRLAPDDANIDITYGKINDALGPDVVGSHPASTSPFGVDDLCGNVGEWTLDPLHDDASVIRGGAFHMDSVSAHLIGRQRVPPEFIDGAAGMRVCAPYPLPRPLGEPSSDGSSP